MNCLRMLANTQRGLHQTFTRTLVISCVLPILFYGSQIWWKGSDVRGMKGLAQSMQVVMNQSLQWICGAFKPTPVHAPQLEAVILPVAKQLDLISGRYALRLNTLHLQHPFNQRLSLEWHSEATLALERPPLPPDQPRRARRDGTARAPPTRLHILAIRSSPRIERITPFPYPPPGSIQCTTIASSYGHTLWASVR